MLTKLTELFQGHLPQLIAFDLDGTLVDSAPDIAVATDRMLVELGMAPAGEENARHWVGNGAAMLVKRALANSHDPEQVARITDSQLEEAMSIFRRCYAEENGKLTQLFAGVEQVLAALSQLPIMLAVITNKPLIFTSPLLDSMNIQQHFKLVVGGECLEHKKPHPLPLHHTAEQLEVDAQHCLMVGDSRNDVEAAKAAGWRSVALTYGYNHGEPVANSDPDWLMEDFRELIL